MKKFSAVRFGHVPVDVSISASSAPYWLALDPRMMLFR